MRLHLPILIVLASFSLVSNSLAEDLNPSTVSEVDALLERVASLDKDAGFELYAMGPEIDPILLQEFANIDLSEKRWDLCSSSLAASLVSRGYDKEILKILKKRLKDDDLQERIAAAVILASLYKYFSIEDLAAFVSGKKDVDQLDEKLFYESNVSGAEVVEQILEILQGDSETSKDFVIGFLKAFGVHCAGCGINARKWKTYFNSGGNDFAFLDWFEQLSMDIEDGQPARILGLTASPDGETIAFAPRLDYGKKWDTNLWVLDTRTHRVTRMSIPGISFFPLWAPSGDMIAFTQVTRSGYNIATINKNGGDFSIWTQAHYPMNHRQKWFPDSNKLAFLRQFHTGLTLIREIWAIDIDAKQVSRVAKDNHCDSINRLFDVWFPLTDTELGILDCSSGDKATEGLYLIPISAPEKRRLVRALDFQSIGRNIQPSPDGDEIAFPADPDKLGVIDLSTGEIRTFETGDMGDLYWTADGKKIIYDTDRICCISLQTGEITELADGSLRGPAFGPGGGSIYYVKSEANNPSIWRVNLDGANNTKIFPTDEVEYSSIRPQPVLR